MKHKHKNVKELWEIRAARKNVTKICLFCCICDKQEEKVLWLFANIALTHWQYKLISIMTTTREQISRSTMRTISDMLSYILKFTRRSNDFNDSLTGKKTCWSCSGRSSYNRGVLAALWFVWTAVPKCGARQSEQFRIYLLICGWYLLKAFIFNYTKNWK